jgi:hypothetical protein
MTATSNHHRTLNGKFIDINGMHEGGCIYVPAGRLIRWCRGNGRGDCVSSTSRPNSGCALLRLEQAQSPHRKPGSPHVIAYCLFSGGIAGLAGAAASFTCAGTARIVVWSSVTVSIAVVAGLGHGSARVNFLWSACHRFLHRPPDRELA